MFYLQIRTEIIHLGTWQAPAGRTGAKETAGEMFPPESQAGLQRPNCSPPTAQSQASFLITIIETHGHTTTTLTNIPQRGQPGS